MSGRLGKWLLDVWDHAWLLHVWGFHEVRLGIEDVKVRIPGVEKVVLEARRVVLGEQ